MGLRDILARLPGSTANADVVRTEHQADGNTYDIYRATSRSAALTFLRNLDVKEERRYAIVETPQGNLGKDFIVIFDERTEETIEVATRKPLTLPKQQAGHCTTCGYPVIPYNRIAGLPSIGSIETYINTSQARENGAGYSCAKCGAICCAVCAQPENVPQCRQCKQTLAPYSQ